MTTEDLDILISRVVDQEASDGDWRALHALAETDPGVWRELAQAQRDHAELSAEVEAALSCVDGVDVPSHDYYSHSLTERVRVVMTWSGWVAAAVIMLAWLGVIELQSGPDGPATAQLGPSIQGQSPEAALEYFLEEGRKQGVVLGEPEREVIGMRQHGEDGVQVLYVLRVPCLTTETQLYMHPTNELGHPDLKTGFPVQFQIDRSSRPE